MRTLNIYGHKTFDFIGSFLGLKNMKIWSASMTLIFLTGFVPYFEKYIYFNFLCFILFNITMVVDIVSAIMLSKIRGGSFETNKGMKALIKLIGYNYLLYLSHHINNFFADTKMSASIYEGVKIFVSESASINLRNAFEQYNLSPYIIFFYAFLIISLSALKNFQLADTFINVKRFDYWIYKNVDIYKNRSTDRLWDTMTVVQQKKIDGVFGNNIQNENDKGTN
jgi:hypothetical protein